MDEEHSAYEARMRADVLKDEVGVALRPVVPAVDVIEFRDGSHWGCRDGGYERRNGNEWKPCTA